MNPSARIREIYFLHLEHIGGIAQDYNTYCKENLRAPH